MKKLRLSSVICVLLLAFLTLPTNAALLSRLAGKIIYDTNQNISWLANANLAESTTFGVENIDSEGRMRWDFGTPLEWINAMNAHTGVGYLGFNNWRLPIAVHPDNTCQFVSTISVGTGCTGSELGSLFYIGLGDVDKPLSLESVADVPPFKNIRINAYWSGTPSVNGRRYGFHFGTGAQTHSLASSTFWVWPVLDGDVSIELLRCDLNDNGKVDAGDLSQVVRMALGSIADDLDCDINNSGFGDGVISIADLVIVSRIVLGIIPEIYN